MKTNKKLLVLLPVLGFALFPLTGRADLPLATVTQTIPTFMAREALEEVLLHGNLGDVLDDFQPKSEGWTWIQKPVRNRGNDGLFEFSIERKDATARIGWFKNALTRVAMQFTVGSDKLALRGVLSARPFDSCPARFEKSGYHLTVDLSKSDTIISDDIANRLSIYICIREGQIKSTEGPELSLTIQMGMDPGSWFSDKERDYFLKSKDGDAADFVQSQVNAWVFALMNATTLHRAKLESEYYRAHPPVSLP